MIKADPFGLGAIPAARPVGAGARPAAPTREPAPEPAPTPKPTKPPPPTEAGRRTTIAALTGERRRHAGAERAQLNILTPAPVLLRFRGLVASRNRPAWEVLEDALDALEARRD